MRYIELVKRVDRDELIVVGMFHEDEIQELRANGYKPVKIKKKWDSGGVN